MIAQNQSCFAHSARRSAAVPATLLLFFSGVLLMSSSPSLAQSQVVATQPTVTVDGHSQTIIQPDEVVFSLSVNTTSPRLDQAREENAKHIHNLVDSLIKSGIAEDDIRTENLRASREYEWTNRQRIFKGFQVQRSLTVLLRDLDYFEDILSALLQLDEVDLDNTNFRNSKIRDLDLEIRRKAVEDARLKAAAMAEQLGQSIGRAIHISDSRTPSSPPIMHQQARMMAAEAAPNQPPLTAPGEIEVNASVVVTFELQ